MIHFTTFFVLVVGGMEAIQPAAAAVLAGLSARTELNMNMFQRRQSNPTVPSQCASTCDPVNSIIGSVNSCTPSECCVASFENSYYNCVICVDMAANVTDYSSAQLTLNALYDACANLGIQLPVLIYPGQSSTQPLSSVVSPSASQTTVSTVASVSQTAVQSTIGPSTVVGSSTSSGIITTQVTVGTNTPTPTTTSSSSFGIRSAETSCFTLFSVAIMLGTWFYFGV